MQACATCRNGTEPLFSITKGTRTGNLLQLRVRHLGPRGAPRAAGVLLRALRGMRLSLEPDIFHQRLQQSGAAADRPASRLLRRPRVGKKP